MEFLHHNLLKTAVTLDLAIGCAQLTIYTQRTSVASSMGAYVCMYVCVCVCEIMHLLVSIMVSLLFWPDFLHPQNQ